jgi:hypothetical protein
MIRLLPPESTVEKSDNGEGSLPIWLAFGREYRFTLERETDDLTGNVD